jgi:cytochrome P450
MGPHFCIGIHLARLEIQIMVREFLRRMPRYRFDEAGEWATSEFQIGWTRLPVTAAA